MVVENSIGRETAESMMKWHYPRMVARHALGAVLSHYEMDLRTPDLPPNTGRAGSTRGASLTGEEFFRDLLTRKFGADRMC